MISKAILRYVRISPFKAREVADLVRGKSVDEALNILEFTPKKAASIIKKVIKSAIANAENNFGYSDIDRLFISKIYIDEGPTLKRYRPYAMGRACMIRKRTSHITVVLDEKKEGE